MSRSMESPPGNNTVTIEDLPEEVFLEIFSYLSKFELFSNIRLVCRQWEELSLSVSLWRLFDMSIRNSDGFDAYKMEDIPFTIKHALGCVSEKLLTLNSDFDILKSTVDDEGVHFVNTKRLTLIFTPKFGLASGVLEKKYSFDINNVLRYFPNLEELVFRNIRLSLLEACINLNKDYYKNLKRIELFITEPLYFCESDDDMEQNECLSNGLECLSNIFKFGGVRKTKHINLLLVNNNALTSLNLTSCRNLYHLCFEGCPVLNNLSELILNDTLISDSCLETIVDLTPNLTKLLLMRCENLTHEGLMHIGTHCKNMQSLSVDKSLYFMVKGAVTGYIGFDYIANGCRNLKYLSAEYWTINDTALESIINLCQNISVLNFAGCCISDEGLKTLVKSCPTIRYLNFSCESCEASAITDTGIIDLIQNCIWMTDLNLDDCLDTLLAYEIRDLTNNLQEKVNDTELQESIEKVDTSDPDTKLDFCRHSHLRRLSLRNRPVSDSFLCTIADLCPDLKEVCLNSVANITNTGIKYLLQRCKCVKIKCF